MISESIRWVVETPELGVALILGIVAILAIMALIAREGTVLTFISGMFETVRIGVALLVGIVSFFSMLIVTGGVLSLVFPSGAVENGIIMLIVCLEIPTAIYAAIRISACVYPTPVDMDRIDTRFGIS